MTIQEAIRKMAAAGTEPYCKVCTVDAVDEDARTVDCTPLDEGAPLVGVNLQANQECGEGVVLFPAVGSYVVVSFLGASVAVVVLAEKVDKIDLKIGDTSAEIMDGQVDIAVRDTTAKISPEGVVINGGGLGGMVRSSSSRRSSTSLSRRSTATRTRFRRVSLRWRAAQRRSQTPLRSWFRQSRANTRASRYRTTRMKKVKH